MLLPGDVAPADEQPGDIAGVRREGIVGVAEGETGEVEGDLGELAGDLETEILCQDDRDWSVRWPLT